MVLHKRCLRGHWKLKATRLVRGVYELHAEELRVHFSDKTISTGYLVAALADEYVITHKKVETELTRKVKMIVDGKGLETQKTSRIKEENRNPQRREDKAITCYQCGKVRHIAAKCQTDRGPETGRIPTEKPQGAFTTDIAVDGIYRPFVEKRSYISAKEGENSCNPIERYGSHQIKSPKRKIAAQK